MTMTNISVCCHFKQIVVGIFDMKYHVPNLTVLDGKKLMFVGEKKASVCSILSVQ